MAKVACDNCTWTGDDEQLGEEDENGELYGATLHQIHHLADRLDPGGVVPAGECPDCGALVYLVEETEDERLARRIEAGHQ